MTLTEFLLARIAEDEEAANEATDGPWRYDPTKVNAIDRGEAVFAGEAGANATTIASTGPPYDMQSMFDAVHIARHDPARVLAECEAKRAIVQHIGDAERGVARAARLLAREGDTRDAQEAEFAADAKLDAVQCIAKHVATVYVDHPDYDEDWRA